MVVVSVYDNDDYISIFSHRYGLKTINLQMKLKGNKLKMLTASISGLGQLRCLIKEQQIGVVQTFSHYSNLIGSLIAWTVGVPEQVGLPSHGRAHLNPPEAQKMGECIQFQLTTIDAFCD